MDAKEPSVSWASEGFQNLFGAGTDGSGGRPYYAWLRSLEEPSGEQEERPDASPDCSSEVFSGELWKKKVSYLIQFAIAEHEDVVRAPTAEKIGVALVPAQRATGEQFVCELTTFTIEEPEGKAQCVCVQRDITSQVSMGHLLSLACTGEYFKLIRERRDEVSGRGSALHLKSRVVPAFQARLGLSRKRVTITDDDSPDPTSPSRLTRAYEASRFRRIACSKPLDRSLPFTTAFGSPRPGDGRWAA